MGCGSSDIDSDQAYRLSEHRIRGALHIDLGDTVADIKLAFEHADRGITIAHSCQSTGFDGNAVIVVYSVFFTLEGKVSV